ncbi:MAG: hypothetical protein K0R82_1613 [Flavipsychrobacter sp.]|jgi:hypothetical protein|nr:hypothetical protein [Flavipsychrobacter sp.]
MKKLTLILLTLLSYSSFAQKNELVFSPGFVYYKVHSSYLPSPDFYSTGHQLAFYYARNIKWLQVGGGIEYGKLNHADEYEYHPGINMYVARRIIAAKPYWAGNLQASYRHTTNKWALHVGPAAGHIRCSAGEEYGFKNNGDVYMNDGAYYKKRGWYIGGQAGASYELLPHLAVSAELTARYADLKRPQPWNGPGPHPGYLLYIWHNRLNLYNFALGVRYVF